MAWYAELKRRKWYCINCIDMIRIHRKKLYDDWYDGLTEQQKQEIEEHRKAESAKRKRDSEMAFATIATMFETMNRLTGGRMQNYLETAKFVDKISFPLS